MRNSTSNVKSMHATNAHDAYNRWWLNTFIYIFKIDATNQEFHEEWVQISEDEGKI